MNGARCRRQRYIEVKNLGNPLQQLIVIPQRRLILGKRYHRIFRGNDGKKVLRTLRLSGIPADDFLDKRLDTDDKLLPGLFTGIADIAVVYILFTQERHIDKSHSPCTITEKKQVAGQGQWR